MAKKKVFDAFNSTNNTTSMVKEFIKIVNSYKNQTEEIKECFTAVTEYCSDEPYFTSIKDSIARQIDVDMLGVSDLSSIEELF